MQVNTPQGIVWTTYDVAGNALSVTGPQGTQTIQQGYNYAAPTQITPNGNSSFATNLAYSSFLGLSSVSGPNGASVMMTSDANARPSSTASPHGATTGYSYNASAAWKLATTNTHWTKEWYDGIGRVKFLETGDTSGTKSIVQTVYDSCACSPVGKIKQVSQPYPASGSPTAGPSTTMTDWAGLRAFSTRRAAARRLTCIKGIRSR